MAEQLPTEYREDYPYVVGRNWRYKQEVSETVKDHITEAIPQTPLTGQDVAGLLGNVPQTGHDFIQTGTTLYCHPFVQNNTDWFSPELGDQIEAYEEIAANTTSSGFRLVNGWSHRQEFGRLAAGEVFWITQPLSLSTPEKVTRNSGQESAGLTVGVSAAGLKTGVVGLFAEVIFRTNNQYVQHTDAIILGKVSPDTGEAETPYHRLSDNDIDKQRHRGCRPIDGSLFSANRLAHFIVDSIAERT